MRGKKEDGRDCMGIATACTSGSWCGGEGRRRRVSRRLTHHHCAGATVPRPCKGRIYARFGAHCFKISTRALSPRTYYPPFSRAGDQPLGWWWVSSPRLRFPSKPSAPGRWSPFAQGPLARRALYSLTRFRTSLSITYCTPGKFLHMSRLLNRSTFMPQAISRRVRSRS